jgi:hypothetical protein
MDALLIGPTLALSFATLVGKALLRALIAAMERTAKSTPPKR